MPGPDTSGAIGGGRSDNGRFFEDLRDKGELQVVNRNRIQRDFQTRQASILSSTGSIDKELYDGTVSICPFSSRAFWACVSGEEEPMMGFPHELYSGIPSLHQWIRNATIKERESHADNVLHDLHNLMNTIKAWSKDDRGHGKLKIDKEWVEREILPSLHQDVTKVSDLFYLTSENLALIDSDVLLKTIVADWNKAFNCEIPALAQPACNVIDRIWIQFLLKLPVDVKKAILELQPFLRSTEPWLLVLGEQVKARFRQALKNITQDAAKIHPDIVNCITQRWLDTFDEAKTIQGKLSIPYISDD
ncbi:hypothetical protein F5Y11DRAFT_351138 [Daldinia sp. FL1419]|nr:hypothetical protein F5Y11DRAFT_351138 [Daldinia sp. FL1419]